MSGTKQDEAGRVPPNLADFPDLVRWLAGPFYKIVNLSVQYVVSYAAITVANILAPSLLLSFLKYALVIGFAAKILHVADNQRSSNTFHWFTSASKLIGGGVLTILATLSADAVVEASLVQIETTKAERAVAVSRLQEEHRRLAIKNGCSDADYAAISPTCQALYHALSEKMEALDRTR